MNTATLTPRDLLAFRRLLAHVLKTNRFYRQKYANAGIRSARGVVRARDFFSLPLTTREELIRDQKHAPPFGTNLTRLQSDYTYVIRTSGTSTGHPFFQPLTSLEFQRFADVMARGYERMGLRKGDVICYLTAPYAYPLFYEITNRIGARMVPVETHTSAELLDRIRALNVNAIQAYPTALFELMEVAKRHHIDLRRLGVKKIFTIGEVGGGHPPTRAVFERAWGAKVIDHIGSLESATLAVICPRHYGYHLLDSLFIAEVFELDKDKPARRGELVLTPLWRRDYPLIRYRTGDMVEIDTTKCPCGRTSPRLVHGILGRVTGQVRLRSAMIFPEDIERIIRTYPGIMEYQIVVKKQQHRDVVDVYAEVPVTITHAEIVALLADVHALLGFTPSFYPVLAGMLPRFGLQKGQRFHDYRVKGQQQLSIGFAKRLVAYAVWALMVWSSRWRSIQRYAPLIRIKGQAKKSAS